MPVPTFRNAIARYTVPLATSATALPPSTFTQWSSTKPTFSAGSCMREETSTGRRPASSARSAVRAARLADRTDENVAAASTSVPPAVASAEIVVQSATSGYYERPLRARLCEDHDIAAIDLTTSGNNADPHALFRELRSEGPIHW